MGLKPGIWFRPLHDKEAEANRPEWLINRTVNGNETVKFLDPSNPEVAAYLRENMRRIISWGYQLIKHDFSTNDLFGNFGFSLNGMITNAENWSFYMVDADCVGVLNNYIDWKLNRQWLDLLARSGSPLFVSIQPKMLNDDNRDDLVEAFKRNSIQQEVAEPLDWLYNNAPQTWLIDGETIEYDFVMDSYPELIKKQNTTLLITTKRP